MKTQNRIRKASYFLALTIIVLTISSISNHAYASSDSFRHQGKPIEPNETKQVHHFKILEELKTEFKDVTTFVHMDEFSLSHKNSHV